MVDDSNPYIDAHIQEFVLQQLFEQRTSAWYFAVPDSKTFRLSTAASVLRGNERFFDLHILEVELIELDPTAR